MAKRNLLRHFSLFIAAAMLFSAAGCGTQKNASGNASTVNVSENSVKINFYKSNLFDFTIVRPKNASSELLGYIKESVFKQARAINNKRPKYITDDNLQQSGSFKGIYIGDTDSEITNTAKKKFEEKNPIYYSYQIMVIDGNVSILGGSDQGVQHGMEYFVKNILKDKNSAIADNYYYYSDSKDTKKLYIDGIDISRFIICCDSYPAGMVYRGCEELQKAIKNFSDYEIPIICGKGKEEYKNYKNIIDVSVEGSDYKAYSIKIESGSVKISGGQDYSLNAALHAFAENISNVPKTKKINIKSDYVLNGTYDDKTTGTDGYRLMFGDDFDGNSLDTNVWKFADYTSVIGGKPSTEYNDKSYVVEDGKFKQISNKKVFSDGTQGFTGINAMAEKWFTYGYFEARLKFPKGNGNFTSFWACGKRTETKPYTPEIDVYECGIGAIRTTANMHSWWNYNDFIGNIVATDAQREAGHKWHLNNTGVVDLRKDVGQTPYKLPDGEDFSTDFHTFGCEWTPSFVSFYVDGQLIWKEDMTSNLKDPIKGFPVSEYAFFIDGQPIQLRLNSGITRGTDNIAFADQMLPPDETTVYPSVYEIDYVRLYQMDGIGKFSDTYYEK